MAFLRLEPVSLCSSGGGIAQKGDCYAIRLKGRDTVQGTSDRDPETTTIALTRRKGGRSGGAGGVRGIRRGALKA